jgi:N-dimethylarginine dimethylaminohydrolase
MLAPTLTCNSMTGRLRRVLVCSPQAAQWDSPANAAGWRDLGFNHEPSAATAQAQHDQLCRHLQAAGVELISLPNSAGLSLDAVYTHDPSLVTSFGAIILNPGKANRVPEAQAHRNLYASQGLPILGEVAAPGTAEAGDMLWLDARTLLVGLGFRTNACGIAQIRTLLAPKEVEVISAPLPYGPGPDACLHLMSLISLVDEQTAVVDLPWLAVETVELLKQRGYRLIEINYSERDTLACNVLSLGERRLVAIAENKKTNQKLLDAGFEVAAFGGSEICINGSGGPTCLTRPLARD